MPPTHPLTRQSRTSCFGFIENRASSIWNRRLLEHFLLVPENLRVEEIDALDAAEGDRRNADISGILGPVKPSEILRPARPPHIQGPGADEAAVFFLVGFAGAGARSPKHVRFDRGHVPLVFNGIAPQWGVDDPHGDQFLVDSKKDHCAVRYADAPLVDCDAIEGRVLWRAGWTTTTRGCHE